MSATADQIARIRRMVHEPTTDPYTDALIAEYIERYPLLDPRGVNPGYWDTATTPPTFTANDQWIPTYDLYAAAADIMEEKAAQLMANFDFSADGGSFHKSDEYEQHMKQARFYRSRRSSYTIEQVPVPNRRDDRPWIANI
jgi:hypothetical protein